MTQQEIEHTETLTVTDADDATSTDAEESQTDENTDATSESTDDTPDASTVSDENDGEDEDDGIKRIRKLNSENKSLRTRLREAEDALKNLGTDTDAFKSLVTERDNYKTQYDELLNSLRTERLSNAMSEASRKAGAIEPSAVFALANTSDVKVEYDEKNTPTNVDAVVNNLKSKYPKLFGATSLNGNAGARNERHADTDELTPKQRMALGYSEKS
jgi:hypothetical protein